MPIQSTTLSPNQRMQPTTYGAMAITDRTRKFLWGRSGNRCAIGNNELVVDATPNDDKSVIARMSATSSRHAPQVHAADANIGVCFIIRSPSARLIPGVDMAVDMSRGKKGARVSFSRLVTTK